MQPVSFVQLAGWGLSARFDDFVFEAYPPHSATVDIGLRVTLTFSIYSIPMEK